jgi:hypothetical protein
MIFNGDIIFGEKHSCIFEENPLEFPSFRDRI